MKYNRICVLVIILTLCNNLSAQSNLSFENWNVNGLYEEPNDWSTSNVLSKIGGLVNCNKGTPHWGQYAVALSASGINDIPAFVAQSFAIDKRIGSIRFFYQYSGTIADSAAVLVLFFKGRKIIDSLVGNLTYYLPYNRSWTMVEEDIVWLNSQIPDSATIIVSTSKKQNSDTIFVDDLSLSVYKVNLTTSNTNNAILIYPNPVKGQFTVELKGSDGEIIKQVSIIDIQGRIVKQQEVSIMKQEISMEDLENGIYTVQVQTSKRQIVKTINVLH
jgi:hypothetical protein